MVSRVDKVIAEPLSVAGRCEPMKVEKPKRARIHKVRQGTPPKLSASQVRKLVRLYVFTKLSWKDISSLILHYGRKEIKKRALQYTLQNLFGNQYDQMRPKDRAIRRRRTNEIQKCKEFKSLQRRRKNKTKLPLQRADSCLPLEIETKYINKRVFEFSTKSNEPANTIEKSGTYLNDFDRYIDVDENLHLTVSEPDVSLLSGPAATLNPSPCFPASSSPYPDADSPLHFVPRLNESNISHPSSLSSDIDSLPFPLDLTISGIDHEGYATNTELQCPKFQSFPFDEGDISNHLENPLFSELNVTAFPPPSSQNLMVGPTSQPALAGYSSRRNHSDDNSQDIAPAIQNQNEPISNLDALVDRVSKCSLEEKEFIKDTLERFSAATISTVESSLCSRLSIVSHRTAENVDNLVPTTPMPRKKLLDQAELSRPAIGRIILNNSIFWSQIVYELGDPEYFCLVYREGVHFGKSSDSDGAIWEDPVLPDQGWLPKKLWSDSGLPGWVDMFGNTSLHIAAICGASIHSLLRLIHNSVNVNALNTAGQTFMHVLDFKGLSSDDMYTLSSKLKHERFIFRHRDVEGRLFIDSFKVRGMSVVIFADCWLDPIERRDAKGVILKYRPVNEAFHSFGSSLEDYSCFGGKSPIADDNVCNLFYYDRLGIMSNINRLFEASGSTALLKSRAFADPSGRGWLHIAAESVSEPPNPTETQQQSFSASRLKVVKYLLSIGVDANHQDNTGSTPLMAHVGCEPYQQAIVDELLCSEPNLCARNKNGETVLHIAMKLGNVDATKALLHRGANIHVRNRKREGLLKVAESAQRHAKDDISLYAKITACMVLAIDAGAIASPNVFQEWASGYQK
ncbi:MAG: hypothetical protein Q9209_003649 [Squamulea sp. 1 TL-2023]